MLRAITNLIPIARTARLVPQIRARVPYQASFNTFSYFHTTPIAFKTNTSTRTKENVHDLETFLTLIGRNCIEHLDAFEGDLNKFLDTTSKQMKDMGIDTRTRRYLLRWKHKFVNDLEPLREHKRGKKKNGGERKAKLVKAKRAALQRLEEKENFQKRELEAEAKGEREF